MHDDEGVAPAKRRRLARWLVPLFFWSLPALLSTRVMMEERGLSFGRAFAIEGVGWMLWALATPGVLILVRMLPIDRRPRSRNVAIHIATGIAMGVVTGLVSILMSRLLGSVEDQRILTAGDVAQGLVIWGLFGLLFYAALATVGLALDYHRRLREREVAASRLEAQLVEARLNALRMQLQPHFLFNALNSVSMLVRQGDGANAVRMVARLSDLLRYILDDVGHAVVPLRTEIDFVSRYLEIEQLRFRDRLNVSINVADAVADTPIPGLLLQPLVENAVRHGVAARAAAGMIRLDARESNGQLEITLVDDGPGLPAGFDERACSGIGLRNTRARIEYTYGDSASFTIANTRDTGVIAKLTLPLQQERTRRG